MILTWPMSVFRSPGVGLFAPSPRFHLLPAQEVVPPGQKVMPLERKVMPFANSRGCRTASPYTKRIHSRACISPLLWKTSPKERAERVNPLAPYKLNK